MIIEYEILMGKKHQMWRGGEVRGLIFNNKAVIETK